MEAQPRECRRDLRDIRALLERDAEHDKRIDAQCDKGNQLRHENQSTRQIRAAQQLRPILEHKQREKAENKLHRLRRTSNRRKNENREGKREKQDLLPSRKNQNEHQQQIQI